MIDAIFIKKYLACVADIMEQEKELLITLDNVISDGDLGLTMNDDFVTVSLTIKDSGEDDCGKLLYTVGKAMSIAAPSAMRTLMANGPMAAGKALRGKQELENCDALHTFTTYEEGVIQRGKACAGGETFFNGSHPGIIVLKETVGIQSLKEAANVAYIASMKGYKATTGTLAVHGRTATRGEESRELKNPGIYVGMLLMKVLYDGVAWG